MKSSLDSTPAVSAPRPVPLCCVEDSHVQWWGNEVERLQQLLRMLEEPEAQPQQPVGGAIAEMLHAVNLMVLSFLVTEPSLAGQVRLKAVENLAAAAEEICSCSPKRSQSAAA